ncbi:MAG: hypothetical protein Q7V57_10120 [Actinomycetota bacterium]|nr:hypothetical protein [Actinomycetota bacterium]
MSRLVLDAGALIALDRGERPTWALIGASSATGRAMVTHAGIVGQVWRDPRRQVRLVKALRMLEVLVLDEHLARAAGLLLAHTGTSDVHDAVLALVCRPNDTVVTSDVDDITRLLGACHLDSVNLVRP